jgi:hypothetical protein
MDRALATPAALVRRSLPFGLRGMLKAVVQAVRPRRICSLCEYERRQEGLVLRALVNEINDPAVRAAFERSAGLCLPHFQMAVSMHDLPAGLRLRLTELEQPILAKLKTELAEYMHKRNASYETAPMGAEADAPLRATRLVSGRVVHSDGRA